MELDEGTVQRLRADVGAATIGKSGITTKQMATSQHFINYICGERLSNLFLYYLLQWSKPQFERIAMGSTIKTIGLSYFKKLCIQVPPRDEQDRIASTLYSLDERMGQEAQQTLALGLLKKGMMQVLLTGKVRVKV